MARVRFGNFGFTLLFYLLSARFIFTHQYDEGTGRCLTLIGMRQGTFTSLVTLGLDLSAEFVSKISKLF